MTFCKELRRETLKNGVTVTAWERIEKNSAVPSFSVTVCRDGLTVRRCDEHKTAKTTWRRKFNQILEEENRK